jgi:hypothetical protein
MACFSPSLAIEFFKEFGGQFLALVAFFAFPAIQYVLLRRFSRQEGAPQLWFIPAYGFRLVIRNLPGKRTLSELKTRAILRTIVPVSNLASVSTFVDEILISKDDFFLFPGTDQVLVSFRLEHSSPDSIDFIVTDKIGVETKRVALGSFDKLICDYSANLENIFNFDLKMGKRAELTSKSLAGILSETDANPVEREFPLDNIRDVH